MLHTTKPFCNSFCKVLYRKLMINNCQINKKGVLQIKLRSNTPVKSSTFTNDQLTSLGGVLALKIWVELNPENWRTNLGALPKFHTPPLLSDSKSRLQGG